MRLPALFAPTLLLVACSGEGLPLNAPDAGPPSDAPDAAPPDAGPSDGGQPPDAGQAPDAGQPDPLQRRDPEDLGFGPVELGREAELTVVLSAADAPRTITLEGDAALRMAPESLAVDPGDEATLQLRFSPTAEGAFRAALVITEGADARRVEVRGDGALTALRCRALTAPLQLAAGQCGTARVACGNEGLGPTTFANVTLTGAGASTRFQDFGPLAPLESRTFEVSICPEATGPFQVVVTAQAPAAQAVVQLQGESAGPRLRAGAVALPPLTLGIPQRLEVPLHNAGLAPAHIDMVEVLGLDPGELTVVRAPAGLAAGFDAVVELRLTATQAGLRSAVLRVHSDDERSPTLDIPLALEVEARPCALTLSPPAIDFGTTTPAGPVRRIAQLVIEHTGQTTCALSMPPLPAPFGLGAVPPDAWSDDEGTHLLLAPGARRAVPIELTGSALGAMSATLSLRYGTPTGAAVLPIPLDARSVAAGLVAEVEPMCLWPGATAARQTVRLSSAAPVVLRQLALDPLGAELGPLTAPPLPVTVTSGALDLGLDLGPQTEGPHLGLLTIEHEVGGEQRVLHVSVGAVVSGFTTVDEFEQLGIPQLDVLWIQDGSASMLDNDLQSGLQDFARHLAAPGQWDARLAVARLDRHLDEDAVVREARGAPAWLDARALGPDLFADAVTARVTSVVGGHMLEQPLSAALDAVDELQAEDPLRPGPLLVIVATDEDDQSPLPLEQLVEQLLRVRGLRNTQLFALSALAGGPTGCATAQGSAGPAVRLQQAVERTGGSMVEICREDWAEALAPAVTVAFGFKSRFYLSTNPIPETLEVEVDGAVVPAVQGGTTLWVYNLATNSLNFSPFGVPAPSAHIEVRYTPTCR